MKSTGLLMKGGLVQSTLRGDKTETRRLAVPRRGNKDSILNGVWSDEFITAPGNREWLLRDSPYGDVGDTIWIREAWRVSHTQDDKAPRDILPPLVAKGGGITVLYEAGGWKSVGPPDREEPVYLGNEPMPSWAGKKRPSMFMPRAFSRIELEITSIHVERLHMITEAGARAEGIWEIPETFPPVFQRFGSDETKLLYHTARHAYMHLWDTINGYESLTSWMHNPLVWVIRYKRIGAP